MEMDVNKKERVVAIIIGGLLVLVPLILLAIIVRTVGNDINNVIMVGIYTIVVLVSVLTGATLLLRAGGKKK